jgi:signal transduction histidine kinase
VVAISADGSAHATAIGAEVYLQKPFEAHQLVAAVGRVLLDAERRKLAQRLDDAERLVLLGTIAAGVGHEINNPLTMATASLDLMDRALSEVLEKVRAEKPSGEHEFGELEPPLHYLQKQLQNCRSGVDRIRVIVRDLHRLSRRPGDERTRVNLGTLLESVISMAWREIESRAEVVRSWEPEVTVFGNEARLGQVFLNLLINAAQSLPSDQKGPQHVHVACRRDGAFAIVEVRDTGRGMTPAQKERIFEPFFTTKGQLGGTGLGLAICKEIVEGHGGVIDVISELGRGSAFTVRLPVSNP